MVLDCPVTETTSSRTLDTINLFKLDDTSIVLTEENYSIILRDIPTNQIISKLFNYMKIAEMDKYGIQIFRNTFEKCLRFLKESDFIELATSYWCDLSHLNCMLAQRGTEIRDGDHLKLEIDDDLLDKAMQGGASSDKIGALLLQRRKDLKCAKKSLKFEKMFFIRNCNLRLWNHEVLVRSYIQNGWLTKKLAQHGMKSFISQIYNKVHSNQSSISFSDNFLHSFFKQEYALDDIPQLYAEHNHNHNHNHHHNRQSMQYYNSNTDQRLLAHKVSAKTLKKWCELVEALTSRGAQVSLNTFAILPLSYAALLGMNTYKMVNTPITKKK